MVIGVLADDIIKEELLSRKVPEGVVFIWTDSIRSLGIIEADVYMDLQFSCDRERISRLRKLLPNPVLVNAVIHTTVEIDAPFIRINAWPTMLRRSVCELALSDRIQEDMVRNIFGELGWQYQLVHDTAGMITPGILSATINEAWFTLGKGFNTKEEIDRLIKGDTDSIAGPFGWGEMIGLENIRNLLVALGKTDPGISIAPLLLKELNGKL